MCMSAQEPKPRKKRPADLNRLAFSITQDATEEDRAEKDQGEPEKNPNAVALGRLGGLKGGKARAEKLTSQQRKEIARKAAKARWEKTREEHE
jgi:hypothetical protein